MRAMNRALAWSVGVHVGVVLLFLVVPRDWFSEPPRRRDDHLARRHRGSAIDGHDEHRWSNRGVGDSPTAPTRADSSDAAGETGSGCRQTAAIGQASHQRRRPTTKPAKPEPAVRPPTTGPQLTQGNTPVDTGARGQGQGLTFGGGGTGGETNLADFCCPEYIAILTERIDQNWVKAQPQRGTTVVRFSILRDGTIADLQVIKPSGSPLLDRASQRALLAAKLPALPSQYKSEKLTVNLTFPYEGR